MSPLELSEQSLRARPKGRERGRCSGTPGARSPIASRDRKGRLELSSGGNRVLQDDDVRFVAVAGSRTPIAAHIASETAYHDEFWPVRDLVTVSVLAYCQQVSDGSDE